MNRRQRIVVIGAGFGGLSFIKKIDKTRYDVVLVDRNNYHSFPPLFYQIASGGLGTDVPVLHPDPYRFPFVANCGLEKCAHVASATAKS